MTKTFFFPVLIISFLSLIASCDSKKIGTPERVERFALGTVCQITFYSHVEQRTIEACFDEIHHIDSLLSRTKEESELSRVNRGEEKTLSEETRFLLAEALEYASETRGLFNPAIGPLVDLWGIGTDSARLPSQYEIDEILPLLDWSQLTLEGDQISLGPSMSLDLGGIAKGYAADRVGEILTSAGVESAIINLGGNVLVLGTKPTGELWRIGLQNPDSSRGSYVGILKLEAMSMVTSGNYERFFEKDGVRYHHIFDSSTGFPVNNNLASVTIVTPKSVDADALSTSLYAMGLEEGYTFASAKSQFEAIFVTKDNRIYLTPGLENHFTLSDGDFTISTLQQ